MTKSKYEGRYFPTTVQVNGEAGRSFLVRRGDSNSRIIGIGADGKASGADRLVSNLQLSDEQPHREGRRRRPMSHHAGLRFSRIVDVRGFEDEGPHGIVQAGNVETRVIPVKRVDSDWVGVGISHAVPNSTILNPRTAPINVIVDVDERGQMVIPAALRSRMRRSGRFQVQIIETKDGTFEMKAV